MTDPLNERASSPESGAAPGWERATLERLAFATLAEQKAQRRWRNFFRLAWLLLIVTVLWLSLSRSHVSANASSLLGAAVALEQSLQEAPLLARHAPLRELLAMGRAALAGTAVETPAQAAQAAHALRAQGPAQVVVTLGAAGAVAADSAGSRYHPGRKVQAVDTTAAGDTFLGALTVALAEGQSLDLAVREGIRASALCVMQAGAQPSIPTRAAVAQSPLPPDWSPL